MNTVILQFQTIKIILFLIVIITNYIIINIMY